MPQLLLLRTKEISECWHLLLPLPRHDFQTCPLPVRLRRKQRMKLLYCHQAVERALTEHWDDLQENEPWCFYPSRLPELPMQTDLASPTETDLLWINTVSLDHALMCNSCLHLTDAVKPSVLTLIFLSSFSFDIQIHTRYVSFKQENIQLDNFF